MNTSSVQIQLIDSSERHQAGLTVCLLYALPLPCNSLRVAMKQRTTPLCKCGEVGYTLCTIHHVMNTSSVQLQRIYGSERHQAGLTLCLLDDSPLPCHSLKTAPKQ